MKKLLMLLIIYFLMIPNVLALNKYKVTFVMDESFKNTIEVEENTTVTAPEPVKEGYTLVGFTNNGVLFDFNTPITSDNIIIYVVLLIISIISLVLVTKKLLTKN